MKRGIATFTLDYGTCPPWLFQRMVALGKEITRAVVEEFGPDEYVKRMADPVWFQSLGTVLAFDWNASGLTTILTAALKEAIRGQEEELGVFIAGGKGKTSRKTPEEIRNWAWKLSFSQEQADELEYSSKMAAKVDSSLVQDGYQIYHHSLFFTRGGSWTVVQQGMDTVSQTARRYHWHETKLKTQKSEVKNERKNFVEEPHSGISAQKIQNKMLNLVSFESRKNKEVSLEMLQSSYEGIMKDIRILRKHSSSLSRMISLSNGSQQLTLLSLSDKVFRTHPVLAEDFSRSKYLEKILSTLVDEKPKSFEQMLMTQGVGPKTVRALSLVAEIIYGASPSYEDPARYSFAHGGKDAIPYPVDRDTYDKSIEIMKKAVRRAKVSLSEKDKALGRIDENSFHSNG